MAGNAVGIKNWLNLRLIIDLRKQKVNKKKILGYIELIESQSMDLTDCDLNKG